MKKYIKPECEICDVLTEGHILNVSDLNDKQGNGTWLAPEYKEEITDDFWE